METGAKQDLMRLGTSTSIKLLRRQLHEWKTLLQHQKQVRQWIQQEPVGEDILLQSTEMFSERILQLRKLSLLTGPQSQERQQLHLRHQQEVVELDRVLIAQQAGLANR